MIYVMSDLHGCYDKYKKLLEIINFSKDDTLYILGDICDRGDKPMSIYLDIMNSDNIHAIKGNHEMMAIEALEKIMQSETDLNDENAEIDLDTYLSLSVWLDNGGDTTIKDLDSLDLQEKLSVYNFIKNLPYYEKVTVGDIEYTLVHAGLGNFSENKKIEDYTPEELVWAEPDFDELLWSDRKKRLIVGHTPTFLFRKDPENRIYHGKGSITDVDCGAVYDFAAGRLGCLRLDDYKEFYV